MKRSLWKQDLIDEGEDSLLDKGNGKFRCSGRARGIARGIYLAQVELEGGQQGWRGIREGDSRR